MKKPAPKKRNPMAHDLWKPKYRVRVVPNKKRKAVEKPKHKGKTCGD